MKRNLILLWCACSLMAFFIISCSKLTNRTPENNTNNADPIVEELKKEFLKTNPNHSLDLDWETTGSYEYDDGSKIALVCVKCCYGEYYFNYDALKFPEDNVKRYMRRSVWLTIAKSADGELKNFVTSAIGDTAYLKKADYTASYISYTNPLDFSGEILLFDISKKLMSRTGYTDGIPDSERLPLKLGLRKNISTKNTVGVLEPGWMFEEVNIEADYDLWKGFIEKWLNDPTNFCILFPTACRPRVCPYCHMPDCDPDTCPERHLILDRPPLPDMPVYIDSTGHDPNSIFPSTNKKEINLQLNTISKNITGDFKAALKKMFDDKRIAIVHTGQKTTYVAETEFKIHPTRGVLYYIHISDDALKGTAENLLFKLTHELVHSYLREKGIYDTNYNPSNPNAVEQTNNIHHEYMINNGTMEMILRDVFPGRPQEFYEKIPYGGTKGSPVWDAVPGDQKKEIQKYFRQEKLRFNN